MAKTKDSRIGRRAQGRDTLVGSSPRSLRRRHGVQLLPRVTDASVTEVTFSDGARFSTRQGRVVHRRGVTPCPGFYFLGLTWQHTRGSALLGWVKDEAEYIARQIDAFAGGPPSQGKSAEGASAVAQHS